MPPVFRRFRCHLPLGGTRDLNPQSSDPSFICDGFHDGVASLMIHQGNPHYSRHILFGCFLFDSDVFCFGGLSFVIYPVSCFPTISPFQGYDGQRNYWFLYLKLS
jgi:hypothetical protein